MLTCRCIWMAESLVDSFWIQKPLFPFSKENRPILCYGACKPKPVTVLAKLFLWLWELTVVCEEGCLCVTGGWGSASLGSASWICRWLEPQALVRRMATRFITKVKGIYYVRSQLVTCQVESWGLKQAAQHREDNSFMGKSAMGVFKKKVYPAKCTCMLFLW